MILDEIKVALEAMENGTEIFEKIVTVVNSEKEKGIAEKSKANKEAQNLRKFKQIVEALGWDGETNLDDFVSNINQTKEQAKTESLTLKSLKTQIQKLEDEIKTERNLVKQNKLTTKLTDSLSNKVYGHNYLIKSLINDEIVTIDGDNIVFKFGDEVLDYNSGIAKVLDMNKDIVKTNQNTGTGEKIKGDAKASNIDAILKSNDQNAIREHLPEIAAELGIKI